MNTAVKREPVLGFVVNQTLYHDSLAYRQRIDYIRTLMASMKAPQAHLTRREQQALKVYAAF